MGSGSRRRMAEALGARVTVALLSFLGVILMLRSSVLPGSLEMTGGVKKSFGRSRVRFPANMKAIGRKNFFRTQAESSADIGVYGMGTMGQNLALNIADKNFKVSVGNRSPARIDEAEKIAKKEGLSERFTGYRDLPEFVQSLKTPRRIVLLVKAGAPVDSAIDQFSKLLEPGDILIDGGNEWYENTDRRAEKLKSEFGLNYIGMGVSGGSEGARYGPSLMPGGDKETYSTYLQPLLEKVAAQIDEGACVTYIGPGGAGNYVKMVHNGIEYGDMQLIAEAYDILKSVAGLSNKEISQVFEKWQEGPLNSFLIELTAKVLKKTDDQTGEGDLVDKVLDKTGMKGTGKWTVIDALELGVPVPTIASAFDGRLISGLKDQRTEASKILHPSKLTSMPYPKEEIIDMVEQALLASKIVAYAQGMSILTTASEARGWDLNFQEIARIWKGGCIIRAELLDSIRKAYGKNPSLKNLLLDEDLAKVLEEADSSWRTLIATSLQSGVPAPSLSASLNYYDSYRREKSPANLVQAQRDAFGAHTYERVDMDGSFTSEWTK